MSMLISGSPMPWICVVGNMLALASLPRFTGGYRWLSTPVTARNGPTEP